MTYLQTHENNILLEIPKSLVMGVDFDLILDSHHLPNSKLCKLNCVDFDDEDSAIIRIEYICNLSDCYNQRPLIEIDGFYQFDVVFTMKRRIVSKVEGSVHWSPLGYKDFECIYFVDYTDTEEYSDGYRSKGRFLDTIVEDRNLGSIFTLENSQKYPELYKEALEIINPNQ
jgi:hypothetical protein